jgi:predicted ATPase
VFLVPLEAVTDPALVAPTIADVLAIPELAGRPLIDGLKHHLSASRTLLVLDNFEQVLDAANVVIDLLATCDRLRAIVTSRAPLGMRLEQEVPLTALRLSTTGATSGKIASEAGQLFLSRVREFRPDFAPDAGESDAIEEICRRVDGLPLAIELAASRMRVLTPRALLDRVQAGIDVLSGGRRDAAPRHQALEATIKWSYELLTPEERLMFRKLSVFAGSFGLEAAEAVVASDGASVDILDETALLVQRSLLRAEEVDAEPRFRMLNTIREFGVAALERSPERESVRARHAQYYVTFAEEEARLILGRDRRRVLSRHFMEVDNLRAAFAWALEQPDGEMTARLLQALLWLRISQGQFAEGKNWTERALRQAEGLGETAARAQILDAAGWLGLFSGDYAGSLPYCEQAHGIFKKLSMPVETARTLLTFGIARAVTGHEEGPAMLERSLALHQELGDPYGIALSLTALGEGARMTGQAQAARECYEGASELYVSIGNVYWAAASKHNLAHAYLHDGDWRRAVALLSDLLDVAREFDFPMMIGHYLAAMAAVAVLRERFELAATLVGAVATLLENLGATFEPADQAELEHNEAAIRRALGDVGFDTARVVGRALSPDRAIAECASLRE